MMRHSTGAALESGAQAWKPAPLAALVVLLTCGLSAQDYHPVAAMKGTVRVMGNSHMDKLVEFWEEGFHRFHPDVRFEKKYLGTANAIAGLYLETADIALMGREIFPIEDVAYRRAFPSGPLDIAVATASFNVPLETFAFAIFVNKENPIEKLTLDQLGSIFGCERAPAVRTWGDLGLKGEWAARPIQRHGYEITSGLGYFFQQKVLGGAHKWNCDFQEYVNAYAPDRKLLANAGDLIVKAVEQDRGAIGFCGFGHATAGVKALPLSENGGRFVALTRANVVNRTYPLTRTVYIFINRQPATPVVTEFLRYVLSRSGQSDVARQNVYLPLPADFAKEQMGRLPK
jgi:phosphate transport system substrate-binding protein